MPWYYAKGSEKIGPLSDAEFEADKAAGKVMALMGAELFFFPTAIGFLPVG